jgi:Uma2 family endonuclease
MAADAALALDPEYPNLSPDALAVYRDPPPGMVAEIIAGTLYTMPRPRPMHQSASGELYAGLSPPFRRGRGGPGGWIILPEPELRLGDLPDLAQPDLAGWHRERLPDVPSEAAISVVPDWVCEILSRSTRRHDTQVKVPMYHRHGVRHLWLVDPEARVLQVFRRVADGWLLAFISDGDGAVRAEPFDAIELDLGSLWSW